MSNAVIVNQVTKEFGKPDKPIWKRMFMGKSAETNGHKPRKVIAVDQVSFAVQEGEIFGVLGPNGSGKSTLIRLIATLLLPDGGDIQVFEYDVVRQPMNVKRVINRVSVEASFFKKLSPMENLMYGARLYGMNGRDTKRRVVEILTRLGLEERSIFAPMEEMSRGMQQKVAIARANIMMRRCGFNRFRITDTTILLQKSTKITQQPIVKAGLTAAVTASVGHIPRSSLKTGFSSHRPTKNVCLYRTGLTAVSFDIAG